MDGIPGALARAELGREQSLIVVYVHIEADDRVVVVTTQDAHSSKAAAASRR